MFTMAKKKHPPTWRRKLKHLREQLDLTQAEAAQKAGVATRTWIAWENQQTVPGRLTQQLLKHAFPELV